MTNIVQTVKKYYKIKIDSRDFYGRFLWFLKRPTPPYSPFEASLHCKRTTFGMQRRLNCNAKKVKLECKCCPFAIKRTFFPWLKAAHSTTKAA